MHEKIEEVIEFLSSFADEVGREMTEDEVIYFAHLFTGIMCSSAEARVQMAEEIQNISNIIQKDLSRIYN